VAPQGTAPVSRLEEVYSREAGRPLSQVGYDTLGTPAAVSIAQAGAIQDSYILGVGDQLIVELRGQENSAYRQRIDRDGRIILPKLGPILAAGRTFSDFRDALEAEVSRAYVSTKAFVSLGETHQVSVLVTGYVRTPGLRIVSALASPLDAILLSGGISKIGSLRTVQLIRNGTVRVIDLYAIVLKSSPVRLGMLQDGDRIFVPPLGATVAIAGSVRQPGIYELPHGASSTSGVALIALAGGTLLANAYDISKSMLDHDGTTRLIPIAKGAAVRSGEIVFVDPTRSVNLDRMTVLGAVQLPGMRPLSSRRTINELFHSGDELLPSAYTLFAVIARRDATTNAIVLVPFSVVRALSHIGSTPLQSNDTVYIFSAAEIGALTRTATKGTDGVSSPNATGTPVVPNLSIGSVGTGRALGTPVIANIPQEGTAAARGAAGGTAPGNGAPGGDASLDPRVSSSPRRGPLETAALASAATIAREQLTGNATPVAIPEESDDQLIAGIVNSLGVSQQTLVRVVSDHLVWVLDQVHAPGVYVAAEGTTFPEVVQAAGGVSDQADLSSVEVTSTKFDRAAGVSQTVRNNYTFDSDNFRTARVGALDVVRLRKVYTARTGDTVTVTGEVHYPGVFDILSDERLSSVLQRAGGLTDVAYPYGAIFTRRSAALHERDGNERSARELQDQLAVLATTPTQNGQQSDFGFLTNLIAEVRAAPTLGRVVVTADPVILASKPDLDVVLEPGDALYVPKRPSSVTVSGEVLNPGSFQFRSGLGFEDYIRFAGGPTQLANDDDAFIVMPDGSADTTQHSWLSFSNSGHIPPGSTIVVPRDLRPFNWTLFIQTTTQILSQLAVTAASVAVLRSY
jgi:protein involved in polysaccharide export with SLBB domain